MSRPSRKWHFKTVVALSLVLALGATGCGTFGGSSADTVTRILADVGCITALVNAGVQVMGDPAVNGASTAVDVLTAIGTVGASNLPATVLAACKDTLSFAAADAQGLISLVSATSGTPGTKAILRPPPSGSSMAAGMAKARQAPPMRPTPVQVLLPK